MVSAIVKERMNLLLLQKKKKKKKGISNGGFDGGVGERIVAGVKLCK